MRAIVVLVVDTAVLRTEKGMRDSWRFLKAGRMLDC
jgi:hypothetical protein